MSGMSCDCGNRKTWRNMQITSAGITATCDRCDAVVTVQHDTTEEGS